MHVAVQGIEPAPLPYSSETLHERLSILEEAVADMMSTSHDNRMVSRECSRRMVSIGCLSEYPGLDSFSH